jgi:hypothetical protein
MLPNHEHGFVTQTGKVPQTICPVVSVRVLPTRNAPLDRCEFFFI